MIESRGGNHVAKVDDIKIVEVDEKKYLQGKVQPWGEIFFKGTRVKQMIEYGGYSASEGKLEILEFSDPRMAIFKEEEKNVWLAEISPSGML
jgi:hypothetical protein